MEQLTNKEKAELTYHALQIRNQKKKKEKERIARLYIIERSFERHKDRYKKNKYKQCKSGH